MILSDKTLKQLIAERIIIIEPITPESIQPASVDCRLGNHYLVVEDGSTREISLNSAITYKELIADEFVIPPHTFLLATTQEYIKVPHHITAFVEGRSSIGRIGLFIQNAGWVDPGFEGRITLELYNANSVPIKLSAGRRICQLVFCSMDQPAERPYHGKYQGQEKTVGSRVFKDQDA